MTLCSVHQPAALVDRSDGAGARGADCAATTKIHVFDMRTGATHTYADELMKQIVNKLVQQQHRTCRASDIRHTAVHFQAQTEILINCHL